jgi:hypothetical protein
VQIRAEIIRRLDVMVAYSCNLACAGCISISDRPRRGIEPRSNIETWLEKWKSRITPRIVTLFGGEPCLHPELVEICQAAREAWPDSMLRLITNGFLLDRHDPHAWFRLAPLEIQVSVHRQDHRSSIDSQIKKILQIDPSWRVTAQGGEREHRQITWSHPDGVSIYKSIFGEFVTPYRANGSEIRPWYSDPAQAHAICGAPDTPILYKGLLYKCPAVANAMDLTGDNWFGYRGLDVTDDLAGFISHIGLPESCCGQCPDRDQAVIINHLDMRNVKIKNLD